MESICQRETCKSLPALVFFLLSHESWVGCPKKSRETREKQEKEKKDGRRGTAECWGQQKSNGKSMEERTTDRMSICVRDTEEEGGGSWG